MKFLTKPDTRSPDVIEENGTYKQQGQRVDTAVPYREPNSKSNHKRDDELIALGKELVDYPNSYAWRVKRGNPDIEVIAERVIAYLHHESLDAQGIPFTPPEEDPDFYSTSSDYFWDRF